MKMNLWVYFFGGGLALTLEEAIEKHAKLAIPTLSKNRGLPF